jgi:hypothetical protein
MKLRCDDCEWETKREKEKEREEVANASSRNEKGNRVKEKVQLIALGEDVWKGRRVREGPSCEVQGRSRERLCLLATSKVQVRGEVSHRRVSVSSLHLPSP